MSIGHLYVLFRDISVQVLCPFFNWILVLGVKLYEVFNFLKKINSGYKPLMGCIIGKYVVPFIGMSFHFVGGFLCCTKSLKWYSLFFLFLAQGDKSEKILLRAVSESLLAMFPSRTLGVLWFLSYIKFPLLYFEFILVYGV